MTDNYDHFPTTLEGVPLSDRQEVGLGKATLGQILADEPENLSRINLDRSDQVAQEIQRRSGIGSDAARLVAIAHFNKGILD